jgi:O-antigen/teichoic acid export membrane protein
LPGTTLLLVLLMTATLGLGHAPMAMSLTFCGSSIALIVGAIWVRGALAPDVAGAAPEYRTPEWLRVSLPMLLTSGMVVTMKHIDTIMLGAIVGTDASGLYYPLARISEIAALGLVSTNLIVAPMISELHSTGQRARLQRLLTLAAMVTSAITLAVAIAFWLVGGWVLGLFGAGFVAGYPALLILLGGQIVNALCGPVGVLMNMTGSHDRAALVLTCAAALNVVLNATLIPLYGVSGAATATALSAVAWNLWMFAEVRRRQGVNPSIFTRWPALWKASTPS